MIVKKIIIPLFLIILAIFIGDKLVFITLNFFYKKTTIGQEGGELNNYLNNSNHPKLLLLGSSTTKLQVDPNKFKVPAVNLAHHSTSPLYQNAILDLLIAKNKIPQAVLLSIHPGDFTVLRGAGKKEIQKEILFLKYYYHESKLIKQVTDKIAATERLKFLFWSYRFNGNVINHLRYYWLSRKKENSAAANFQYQQSGDGDSLKVMKLLKEHAKKLESEVRKLKEEPVRSLINIIEICKRHNIQLFCFYMPMLLDRPQTLTAAVRVTDSIMTSYGIPYLKISKENAPVLFQNPAYWVDLQHLNEKGGKIETALLSEFVETSFKR